MKKVVFLNGAPNSGKDTIGEALAEQYKGHTARFKEKLYQHTAELFNVDLEWLKAVSNDRIRKEVKTPALQGFSPREALIFTSENVYKPIYGKDYFGKELVSNLKDGITFITDCGFVEEVDTVVNELGKENCILFRIHRKGCNFESDSRSHIYHPKCYSECVLNLENDLDRALSYITETVDSVLLNK